jgi:hypothetical protein
MLTLKSIPLHRAQSFGAFFTALDVDKSGTTEEKELRTLLATTGRIVSAAKMRQLFASVDRPMDAKLNRSDFVSLMMKHGLYLIGSNFEDGGVSHGTFNSITRLMMLTYRRQQVLRDFCDPGTSKRRHFYSDETFTRAYGSGLPLMPAAATSALQVPEDLPVGPVARHRHRGRQRHAPPIALVLVDPIILSACRSLGRRTESVRIEGRAVLA